MAEPEVDLELADSLLSFAATIWSIARIDDRGERESWIRRYVKAQVRALEEPGTGATLGEAPEQRFGENRRRRAHIQLIGVKIHCAGEHRVTVETLRDGEWRLDATIPIDVELSPVGEG